MSPSDQMERERKRAARDALVLSMLVHLRAARLDGGMVREHRFHPTREWRFDMAWPAEKVALEVDGAVYTGGRHTRGKGYSNDCRKFAEAVVLGWRVVRVTSDHIGSGEALQWMERLLK